MKIKFPSPLEVWVVSYAINEVQPIHNEGFRPLSRYEWFPTR